MNTILRIDNRGRLVIPTEFREALKLKDGDELLLSLDEKMNTLVLSPISGQQTSLIRIDIEFADQPGSLAKTASVIAKMNLDLIMTESKSFSRGRAARWMIIADRSRCPFPDEEIRKTLLSTGLATSVTILGISPGQLPA
jgi:AbrB family looped-hinge helix DNA binding protein